MKMRINTEQLKTMVNIYCNTMEAANKKWLNGFENDPIAALTDIDSLINGNAKLLVLKEIKEALENDRTAEQIATYLQSEVINSARFDANSNHSPSNTIKRAILAVKAELVQSMVQG